MSSEPALAVPQLLVSVRSADEVLAALAGGADWIDLKEPSAGALAGVEVSVAQAAVQTLAGRRTLSAALGELRDWEGSPAQGLLEVAGIEVVKLGLAGCGQWSDWQQRWLDVAAQAAHLGKRLVAVAYADWREVGAPAPAVVVQLTQQLGGEYLLIDTYDKSQGTTFDHLSPGALESLLQTAAVAGQKVVLAGSLSPTQIERVPPVGVSMIAVRGAVCRGERTGQVATELVEGLRQSLVARFTSLESSMATS